MIHRNEPPGNKGVTLNGREVTDAEAAEIRKALRIAVQRQLTLKAGETLTVPWTSPAMVHTLGTEFDVEFAFEIPQGIPGLDGTGSIMAVDAVGVANGQDPDVINLGTPERARLRFYIPEGPRGLKGDKGDGIPANPIEGYVIGYENGVVKWMQQSGGTTIPGTGGTTIIDNSDLIQGLYAWETAGGGTTPVPAQTMFDAATYSAYQAAIAGATSGNKRVAAANAVIAAMGTAQALTMKRNGLVIFTVSYTGQMVQTTVGLDVVVSLATMGTVSPIDAADVTTGVWTMEITGGTGMTRKITLPVAPDAATGAGNGFNPGTVSLILPRSMDGL